jgi:hypothetical protein
MKKFFDFFPANELCTSKSTVGLDDFDCYILPATGPRGFGFDHAFHTLPSLSKKKKWIVGGSFGALRAAAILFGNGTPKMTKKLARRFRKLYYRPGDTPDVLHKQMLNIYESISPSHRMMAVLSDPITQVAILVTKLKEKYCNYGDTMLKATLAGRFLYQFIDRDSLDKVSDLVCFHTGTTAPTHLFGGNLIFAQLTKDNFHAVLHASSCIRCGKRFVFG